MPGYIMLIKWTEQGVGALKDAPARLTQAKEVAGKMGMRFVGAWVTMGEQDVVAVWDAPDDQTMAAFVLAYIGRGTATTKTMRAFSEEEFAQIVSRLP